MNTNNLPQAGRRVVSKSGMCGNVQVGGVVLCHVENRWGVHAVVMMDDGKTRQCDGLAGSAMIGWHYA